MKKIIAIIIIILVVLGLGIGGIFILRGRRPAKPTSPTPGGKEEAVLEVPLSERPFVTLTPRNDGREFTMEISRIKNIDTVEYELVYLSQGLSRGVIGSIDLNGQTSISRKLLLGTCSRNVCKYDEGIEEGTLTLRFRGAAGTRKFIADFHLQQGVKELTSIDGKFKLAGKLPSGAFYITMSTVGLPKEIEGKIVGGPYGVFTSGSEIVKNGVVTLSLSEKSPSAKLYSWDEKSWIEEKKDLKMDGDTLSASVDTLATFVAVTSE